MNVSEPLMKCRENVPSVKTAGSLYGGRSTTDNLIYWSYGRRHEGGMSPIRAFLWNSGKPTTNHLLLMQKRVITLRDFIFELSVSSCLEAARRA
jgi:hypothetical protein